MKGIYQKTLVDIVEKTETQCRIQTNYGIINTSIDNVLPVPEKVFSQYAEELEKNDEYREEIRKKQEEIKERYLTKKDELDRLSTRAWQRKQAIIKDIYYKALMEG